MVNARQSGVWLAVMAAALALCACGNRSAGEDPAASRHTGAASAEPTDAAGADPPRLAVLSPGLADILREIGAGGAIVARHDYDSFTDPDIPAVGDQAAIDYEGLLRADPDVVVLEGSASGTPEKLFELGERSGWRVEVVPLLSLSDVRAAIGRMGTLAGADAGAIREVETEFDAACEPSDDVAALGRTLILLGESPPGAVGPGSLHYELLERMGARPVPEEGAAFITMNLEDIAKLNPESILVFAIGEEDEGDDVLGPIAGLPIDAVRHGRVVVIDDPRGLLQSTAIIGLGREVRAAASALHAESGG